MLLVLGGHRLSLLQLLFLMRHGDKRARDRWRATAMALLMWGPVIGGNEQATEEVPMRVRKMQQKESKNTGITLAQIRRSLPRQVSAYSPDFRSPCKAGDQFG